MRIIAGAWRGRPIDAPPGQATRPTADRVRETLFSMLASRLGSFEDLRVADLFAGSRVAGEAFTDEVVDHYLNNARVELEAFEAAVTDWERFRGFERL